MTQQTIHTLTATVKATATTVDDARAASVKLADDIAAKLPAPTPTTTGKA